MTDLKPNVCGISIHAPRAGCDTLPREIFDVVLISIHAPRAGCDVGQYTGLKDKYGFQSTHPVRGATEELTVLSIKQTEFQSTHPVRGAT